MDFCEWGQFSGLGQCNEAATYSVFGRGLEIKSPKKRKPKDKTGAWHLCEVHLQATVKVTARWRG